LFCGIIGTSSLKAIPPRSYSHKSCSGWGYAQTVHINGASRPNYGSWEGWEKGETGIFSFDPSTGKLTVQLKTSMFTSSIDTELINSDAFIHVHMAHCGTVVKIEKLSV
jgi:hypothetical protein